MSPYLFDVLVDVERAFGVCVSDVELADVWTVGELHQLVMSKRWTEPVREADRDAALLLLRRICAKHAPVPFDAISEDSMLLDDLGFD